MAKFKPLLPFGNQTVIERTIQYLRSAGVQTIVVVIGHRSDDVRKVLLNEDVSYVLNEEPNGPMAESIKLGMAAVPASAGAILITPVDHAAVSPETITALLEQWRSGARLVIPTWQDRGGHPVLIDRTFRAELLRSDLANGLRSFFETHKSEVVRLPVSSSFVVRDMDTWEDYVQLHRDFFGFPPGTDN
jgi:CTP:molybdopterin cytidylyltransferase MocA